MRTDFFRKLLASIIIISSCFGLFAQESNQSVLSIGTKHGVVFSSIIFDPSVKQDITLGYTGGLVIKYVSETHAGIQVEVNYSQRGWTENLDSSANSYKRSLTYFEVPILTHFVYGSKKTKFFINVGPNLSFHTSDKENFSLHYTGDTLGYYQRKLDNDFELGLVGGIGLGRVTSIGDFQLEFRFHYGLQNIFSTNLKTDIGKSQNQLYVVTLGYFFFKKDFRAAKKKLE